MSNLEASSSISRGQYSLLQTCDSDASIKAMASNSDIDPEVAKIYIEQGESVEEHDSVDAADNGHSIGRVQLTEEDVSPLSAVLGILFHVNILIVE